MKSVLFVGVAGVAFLCSSAPLATRTAPGQSVPNPTVTGPIAAAAAPGDPSHQYPFFSTTVDLASHGYVEEEYFFEGTASRFNIPASLTASSTPQTAATVVQTGVPYRTRMIVRRPISALNFNGTVVMEWQNVAFGFDVDGLWGGSGEHLMRRGYAWIGVSAQRVGVNGGMGLKAWSPARYGTLDLTAGNAIQDDSLGYDIFSQAAQSVRNPLDTSPMGTLQVERIIGVGISLGATYLVAYQNAVHPLAGVFDGFMPLVGGWKVNPDSEAKAFKVFTETEVAKDVFRQQNSDRFRRWEVAGAAHLPYTFIQAARPLMLRDLNYPLPENCTSPPFSRIPWQFVLNAALDAMVRWVKEGIEPAIAPDMEVAATDLGGWFPTEIARDAWGNALGGIRLAEHAVPTATNTGLNGPVTSPCRTYGSYQPFDQETLDSLYPNHGTYVSRVTQVTQGNVQAGFVVGEDAMVTIETAAQSTVGKRQ